jgi:hypothetical protein
LKETEESIMDLFAFFMKLLGLNLTLQLNFTALHWFCGLLQATSKMIQLILKI